MLDPKFVREHPEKVKEALRVKHLEVDLDRLLEIDAASRGKQARWEELRSRQKKLGASMSALTGREKEEALRELGALKEELKSVERELPALKEEAAALFDRLPSLPAAEVPEGLDERDNVELYCWGEKPDFDFPFKDHVDLCFLHDLVDFERASRMAGSRTYFLKNELALLDLAVQRFAVDLALKRGFQAMQVPLIVRREAMYGTAYFPGGEDQAYHLERDGAYLIGTSEVPVASFHMNEILQSSDLPKRYAGISTCFRREAGAAGKDTRGLYRVHQFNKIEQVVVCENDEAISRKLHQEILKNAQDLLESLRLPYRVVNVCGGDLGQGQVQKFDIETWMPSRGAYGETHSASRFHDFQARRLNLRYRDAAGRLRFCHTLNNTLVASPRILIALLENFQKADGSIDIPEVLWGYTGFKRIG
jgi:seryl-tRNA synthetase